MSARIYLDHAATTPVLPEARAAMMGAMERWANPSSPHAEGRAARAQLEDARTRIKAALDWSGELIFTATASEAASLAFRGCHLRGLKPAVSSVEHDAVRLQAGEGGQFNLSVGADGLVNRECLGIALRTVPGRLIAVQHCNSETGVIQPIGDMREAIGSGGSHLLVDCAQSAGKIPLPSADLMIVSSTKVGGPPGVAALLVRDLELLLPTGGQEGGYRRGTENLPAVLGFAAALEARTWDMERLAKMRTALEHRLWRHDGVTVCAGAPRSPAIAAYAMPGLSSAAQLVRFDAMGFAVSAGSACSSGSLKPGHVLSAIGLDPGVAERVIRVSFGPTTTMDEVMAFADAWIALADDARARAA